MNIASQTDQYHERISVKLAPETLRRLSRINSPYFILHVIGEWLFIAIILGVALLLDQIWAYIIAVILIGSRQHALGVLMHDASHYRMLKNKKKNDCLSDLLLAWPLLITTSGYRTFHFPHHRYVNTEADPDYISKQSKNWRFPKPRIRIYFLFLKDLLGLHLIEQLREIVLPLNKGHRHWLAPTPYTLLRISYYAGIIASLVLAGQRNGVVVLILWLVAYVTWLKFALRLRSISEHFGVENQTAFNRTRTTLPNWPERLLLAPKNVGYHLEHHLYPSVPFFRLPELHRELQQHDAFHKHAHITAGYSEVIEECASNTIADDSS